jgi:beta-mannosidase
MRTSSHQQLLTGPWHASSNGETADVQLPNHWQDDDLLLTSNGPVTYTTSFSTSTSRSFGSRTHLVVDGVMNQAYVWLNGELLGDVDGYTTRRRFDITEFVAADADQRLKIEVSCPPLGDRRRKRSLTGAFQHSLYAPPGHNPGGIAHAPKLVTTGPICIDNVRVSSRDVTITRATLDIAIDVDVLQPTDYNVECELHEVQTGALLASHMIVAHATPGRNTLTTTLGVDNPPLWWPRELGDAQLVTLTVVARTDDSAPSDSAVKTFGIREVATNNFVSQVNGKRLYLRGLNCGPWSLSMTAYSRADFDRDFAIMQDAGINMIRLHAHVAPDELYEAADRAGMLVWQDLPLQWGYARRTLPTARKMARDIVARLGHHPSVLLWCVHSTPIPYDIDEYTGAWRGPRWRNRWRGIRAQILPSYNRTMLDTSVARTIGRLDPTREVVSHTGMLPTLLTPGTTFNSSFGWGYGNERNFARFIKWWPRAVRFVSDIGPQSASGLADSGGATVPSTNAQLLSQRVSPDDFATPQEWATATQAYQAMVIRHHVEALRRCKYRPSAGFAISAWAPTGGDVSQSVYGPEAHASQPKLAWTAIANSCAPLIVVAERPLASYRVGQTMSLPLHVVNDRQSAISDAHLSVTVTSADGVTTRQFVGTVHADEVTYIATLDHHASQPGVVRIDLVLTTGDDVVTNHYITEVVE